MDQEKMYQAFLEGTLDKPEEPYGRKWLYASLILGLIYMVVGQQLLTDFWFEDDTNILFYIEKYTNPLLYFGDIETMRALSPARTLTPMQPLSFMIDHLISGRSPWFFYAHVVLVALATQAVLWILLRHITNPVIATTASICWIINPATMAVTEFISARHYLEGMLLIGLGCLAAWRASEKEKRIDELLWTLVSLACYLLASASKELSVTNGYWIIAAVFVYHRKWLSATLISLGPILYFLYRNWAIGLIGQGFDKDWSILWDYQTFVSWLPFMLTGSWTGPFIFALGGLLLLIALVRKQIRLEDSFWWVTHLVIALITILPVSIHWMASANDHGTWYRVGFFLNTFWIVLLCWLIFKAVSKPLHYVLMPVLVLCFSLGSYQAIQNWDKEKTDYRPLADFYLKHPDRLVYLEIPSIFFLGWHNLNCYRDPIRFVHRQMDPNRAESVLARHKTIWRKQGDRFVQEQMLYNRLFYNATHERIPLDGPLPKAIEAEEAPVFARHEAVFENQKLVIYRKRDEEILSQHVLPPENAAPGLSYWAWPRAFVKEITLGLETAEDTRVTLVWPDNTRETVELKAGQPQMFEFEFEESFKRPLVASIETEAALKVWSFALSKQDMILQSALIQTSDKAAVFPHFPKSNGGWESRLAMINTNQEQTNVAVTWYDEAGKALRNTYNLPPGQSFLPTPNQHPPVSAVVESVAGTLCFQTWQIFDERQSFIFTPPLEKVLNAPYLQSLPNTGKATPSLAFWNPNDQPVQVRLLDQSGAGLMEKIIEPHRKWVYVPIPTQIPVHVSSDAPVTGLALWRTPWQQWTMAACVPTAPSLREKLLGQMN